MAELQVLWKEAQNIRKELLKEIAISEAEESEGRDLAPEKGYWAGLMEDMEGQIEDKITEFQRFGAFVREIEPGLVAFYSVRAGRPVIITWQAGEEEVSQWLPADEDLAEFMPISDKGLFGREILH